MSDCAIFAMRPGPASRACASTLSNLPIASAKFTPYEHPRQVAVPNVLGQAPGIQSPGYLTFTLDGRAWRLEPVYETDEHTDLFLIFKDLTSRDSTYPAGRFLHAPLPQNGYVMVDFDKAYNPPCAFTNFATCPLPTKQNRLPLRIDAGELAYHAAASPTPKPGSRADTRPVRRPSAVNSSDAVRESGPDRAQGLAALCLGVMTYGDPAWRSWVLPEEASRPFIKRALEAGHQLLRHRRHVLARRVAKRSLGRAIARLRAARDERRDRDQGVLPDVRRPERSRPVAQAHHGRRSTRRCSGSASITSTSTRSTAGIHDTPIEETLRGAPRRRAGRQGALHRRVEHVRRGSSRRRCTSPTGTGWTRFVSMQNHYNLVYREEEREMLPLCREEGIGVIPWSPLARGFLAGNRRAADKGDTERAKTDAFAHQLYYADSDFRIVDRAIDVARRARASRRRRSRSPGFCSSRGSPRRSSARRRWRSSIRRSPRLDIALSRRRARALETPYEPHAVNW